MAKTVSARAEGLQITKEILLALTEAGGSLAESFLDPYHRLNVSRMFIDEGKIRRFRLRNKLRALERQKLITYSEKKNGIQLSILPEGERRALVYQLESLKIDKLEWWDRKWRMVLFDIPEERKSSRNAFKKKLDQLGFIQLQHSVYVHPYECHNQIELIRVAYEVKQFVKILLVDKIEGELELRKKFGI